MEPCFFAKEPPKIEVRGGIIFIQPDYGDYKVAFTPHILGLFVAAASEALAKWQVDQLDHVVPISGRGAH